MFQCPRRVQLRYVLERRKDRRLDAEEVCPRDQLRGRRDRGLGRVRDVRGQEREVEGCDGDGKEVDDGYEGDCKSGASGRTGSGGSGQPEGRGAGEVD